MSNPKVTKNNHFLGVDVSKKTLDFCLLDAHGQLQKKSTLENNATAIGIFFDALKKEDATFSFDTLVICLEHTGIYVNPLLEFLTDKKAHICLEMALQIKQSQGVQRGKNDQVDAFRIAQYAYTNQHKLRYWVPTRIEVQKLKALLTLRERLIGISNQLEVPLQEGDAFMDKAIQKELRASSKASVAAVQKDIKTVDEKIDALIRTDKTLNEQIKVLTSITGIGRVIATHMIATTNEFKSITEAKKYACYAGVAPFERTSGTSVKGKPRVSKLANMTIKKLLHLGATSAIQHSEELKAYYQRKIAEGKKPMNVINAVRNKLISRAFACIRDQRPYEKIYKHGLA